MSNQKDVARLAGISSASISRYINNNGFISNDLKEKIQKAIVELNYKPNLIARSLKLKSSKTIAFIFPDIENAFFIQMISRAEEVAFKEGFNVVLCNTQNNPEKEKIYIEVLKGKLIDGYLVITAFRDKEYIEKNLFGENVVFIDRSLNIKDEIVVKLDNSKAMELALEHLIKLGHNKIGLVIGPTYMTPGRERLKGFIRVLKKNNIYEQNKDYIKMCGYDDAGGYEKTIELLGCSDRPTAFIPVSNRLTIGALKAVKKLGLNIPDDISILAFDDLKTAELLCTPITAIAQSVEFGETGMNLLIKKINGENIEKKTIKLEPKLIIRESVKNINNI